MKNRPALFFAFLFFSGILFAGIFNRPSVQTFQPSPEIPFEALYQRLELAQIGLKASVFRLAINGYQKLNKSGRLLKRSVVSICDLSQSANNLRLYVIDLDRGVLLYHTLVAHGKQSGEEFARQFGNHQNSHLSSLGFYITGATYKGQHGTSLRLEGQEKGFNDQALMRGIVVHGADYVSEEFIRCNGRLGRSQGCPAVPSGLCDTLVSCIQGGSCFFMYYPDPVYLKQSLLICPD